MLGDHPVDQALNGTWDMHGMILGDIVVRASERTWVSIAW
jgi:hypothetical protein